MKNIGIIIGMLQGGGAERCAADLSVIFSNNGYKVYIITDLSNEVRYEYGGILVDYDFSVPSPKSETDENPLKIKANRLKEIKHEYGIDISISFMQYANYLNILSKDSEKVILTTHSVNSEYAKLDKSIFWSNKTFSELYQFADLITFPSDYCRKDWIEHWGDKNNITKTVYNPVHLMEVDENTTKENIVISIGRMQAVKRQWHLIRAFKRVKELCPDSRLVILGDGELREKLKLLVRKLGLEGCVEMPGNVINVGEYLAKAKVFALTSRYEAMPCAVLEALSAGVPVVAFDIPGGIREELGIDETQDMNEYPIIGKCGIVTKYTDGYYVKTGISPEEEMLADEIVKLLNDEDLRNTLSVTGRKYIDRFSPQEIGNKWVGEILNDILVHNADDAGFEEAKEDSLKEFLTGNVKQCDVNVDMYISYYRLLEKWMLLKERGINVSEYFARLKMTRVIIYGLGKMADHLIKDLVDTDVDIICAIDRRAEDMFGEFPIIPVDRQIPDADCIVVTPVYQFEKIKEELGKKTSNRIISLTEVIDGLL